MVYLQIIEVYELKELHICETEYSDWADFWCEYIPSDTCFLVDIRKKLNLVMWWLDIGQLVLYIYIYIYAHTHTHTHSHNKWMMESPQIMRLHKTPLRQVEPHSRTENLCQQFWPRAPTVISKADTVLLRQYNNNIWNNQWH